jgi:hypothetical protein
MKRQFLGLVLTGLLAGNVLLAQGTDSPLDQNAPHPDSGALAGRRDVDLSKKLDKQLARMSKRYKLTAEQQAQIKTILMKDQQDMQTVSADTYMLARNRSEEAATLHEASNRRSGRF